MLSQACLVGQTGLSAAAAAVAGLEPEGSVNVLGRTLRLLSAVSGGFAHRALLLPTAPHLLHSQSMRNIQLSTLS